MGSFDIGDIVLIKDKVYKALKAEIILGHYKPGAKLNIIDLSNQLNVSGAPIREALNMLAKEGLVVLPPHKKAYVSELTLEDWDVSYDLRLTLEPYAAELSVMKIPQEAIDTARDKLYYVLKNPTDMTAYIESDMMMHEMLYQYCGSKLLSEVLAILKIYTTRALRYSFDASAEYDLDYQIARNITSNKEHMRILDTIDRRDGDQVYAAVKEHIERYTERSPVKLSQEGHTPTILEVTSRHTKQ